MSFDSLLNQIATIERNQTTQDPDSGQEVEGWVNVAENIPCRLDPRAGRLIDKAEYEYEQATHILFSRPVDGVDHKEIKFYRVDIDGIKYKILVIKSLEETTIRHHWETFLELIG